MVVDVVVVVVVVVVDVVVVDVVDVADVVDVVVVDVVNVVDVDRGNSEKNFLGFDQVLKRERNKSVCFLIRHFLLSRCLPD